MRPLWVVVLAVVSCGCRSAPFVGHTSTGASPSHHERMVLQRAGSDLQCGPEDLYLTNLGAGGYRIEGCGRTVTYSCVVGPPGAGIACTPLVAPPAQAVLVAQAPTVGPPAPRPTTGPEADATRTAIAARAASILACVPDAAIAVDATWNAAGVLSASLTGARAGTAEEECVRAALADARVEPAGAGGHIIHAIER